MQHDTNFMVVEHLCEIAENFKPIGDAQHDGLIIAHVKNTPKGENTELSQWFLRGCTCTISTMLLGLALHDERYKQMIIAVGQYLSQGKPGSQIGDIAQMLETLINQAMTRPPINPN